MTWGLWRKPPLRVSSKPLLPTKREVINKMRNLDEILADAKVKNVDRLQPHTHETRVAPVPGVFGADIPQSKAAPKVPKRQVKINKRMLAIALFLSIVALGVGVYAFSRNAAS